MCLFIKQLCWSIDFSKLLIRGREFEVGKAAVEGFQDRRRPPQPKRRQIAALQLRKLSRGRASREISEFTAPLAIVIVFGEADPPS